MTVNSYRRKGKITHTQNIMYLAEIVLGGNELEVHWYREGGGKSYIWPVRGMICVACTAILREKSRRLH